MSKWVIYEPTKDSDGVDCYIKRGEIVHCQECKYCVNGQCWKSDGLDKLDGNVADDDFCSRGEREGE